MEVNIILGNEEGNYIEVIHNGKTLYKGIGKFITQVRDKLTFKDKEDKLHEYTLYSTIQYA